MKVVLSSYLDKNRQLLKKLLAALLEEFEYASILASDTAGTRILSEFSGCTIQDAMLAERGCVARVYNSKSYSEYSFNELSEENFDSIVEAVKKTAKEDLGKLEAKGIPASVFPAPQEEPIKQTYFSEVEMLPEDMPMKEKLGIMQDILDGAKKSSGLVIDFKVYYEEYHVSKVFYSAKRDLEQSYVFTSAGALAVAQKDNDIKYEFDGVSGLKGPEALKELRTMVGKIVQNAVDMLGAKRITPGEYDVICDPKVAGLVAHEAFGHGVEMDMFVKNRAKGAEYLGKYVASKITQMRDGAQSARDVATYLFDDEGSLGTDTKVIEDGILKSGISDLLSALRLGTAPTGNGRRETFERKAYARMTNTFFEPGSDKLEDMIASIEDGFLLESYNSGMEDPKNWGIQCMISRGRQIKNGKLTGKVFAPVLMTGYVPDVLKSITMVSDGELYLSGSGHCGKGYKEWAKTSIGGTYIKLRGRLG